LKIDMSSQYSMVVPYGGNIDSLAVALKEFPTKKVIALVPARAAPSVIDKVRTFLVERNIKLELREVPDEATDGFFLELERVKQGEENPIVNVSVGTPLYSDILLCAAMATGVTAFGIFDGELVFLPISCSISHGK
jgi:hypothetical protein